MKAIYSVNNNELIRRGKYLIKLIEKKKNVQHNKLPIQQYFTSQSIWEFEMNSNL